MSSALAGKLSGAETIFLLCDYTETSTTVSLSLVLPDTNATAIITVIQKLCRSVGCRVKADRPPCCFQLGLQLPGRSHFVCVCISAASFSGLVHAMGSVRGSQPCKVSLSCAVLVSNS